MQVNMEIHEDDTASGNVVFAVSDQLAEMLGMTTEELLEAMELEDGSNADGSGSGGNNFNNASSQEAYQEDGYTGTRYFYDATPLNDTLNNPTMSVIRDGDTYVVDGIFEDILPDAEAQGLDQAIIDSADVSFTFTFPGEVVESNGTVNGNTVTWNYTPGEDLIMTARASALPNGAAPEPTEEPTEEPAEPTDDPTEEPATTPNADIDDTTDDDSGVPTWLIVLLVTLLILLAVLIGIIVAVVSRSRKKDTEQQTRNSETGPHRGSGPGTPLPYAPAPPAQTGHSAPPPAPQQQQSPYQPPAPPQNPPAPPAPPEETGR